MTGTNSIVEFEAVVSHKQQEQIVEQLNRQGVVTESSRRSAPRMKRYIKNCKSQSSS